MKNSLVACLALAASALGLSTACAAPTPLACTGRDNNTASKIVACIQAASLWRHLSTFQHIANANPDTQGHGNRDTGTHGYRASLDYVAGLMRGAGYKVRVQSYPWTKFTLTAAPVLAYPSSQAAYGKDWFVARLSAPGLLAAPVRPAGDGCEAADFASFERGSIALLQRGACEADSAVANAAQAGSTAVILYNQPAFSRFGPQFRAHRDGRAFAARLAQPASIPVIGYASNAMGADLARRSAGGGLVIHLDVAAQMAKETDYNLIADSPYGDSQHVLVVEAHLDSIFGAGMLDNASGSTTILDVALAFAKTPTTNQLRFVWFGGEELGLLGSAYYTKTLSRAERARIAFDVDVDVTATPNYDVLVADPAFAYDVKRFPPNVVPQSRTGNREFYRYFQTVHIPSAAAPFGNDGTDSNSFSLIGVPNTGILTQQDCCKKQAEVDVWGGSLGNYEGNIPSHDGGCVDRPNRYCDNLSNNDPLIFEAVSKSVGYVTFRLANDPHLP